MKKWIAGLLTTATFGAGATAVVDQQRNPYQDKGTHYELPIVSGIPQGERVEIAKHRAAMTMKGWNDEYAITIEPQIPTALLGAAGRPFVSKGNRPLLSKKMEYRSGDVTAFIEPRDNANEFDIDFTLAAKPDTNVFTYKIAGADDFDFFYQAPLNEEPLEGLDISCTETQCFGSDGSLVSERPQDVIGSYAVYSKIKAHHKIGGTNYATGKIMHIYRPKVSDANGVEEWAQLDYKSGVLSVTVPQTFLNNAIYPVVVDPTFGLTSIGATASTISNTIACSRAAPASGGTVSNVTAYVDINAANSWKAALYASSTEALQSPQSGTQSGIGGPGWDVIAFTGPTITTQDYLICIWGQFSSGNLTVYRDTGGTSDRFRFLTFGSWPDPLASSGSTLLRSIYATYTETPATDVNASTYIRDGQFYLRDAATYIRN